MKVSKALIEKYHAGNCTAEERAAVENWLLDDAPDEAFATTDKTTRNAIWQEVKQVLPSQQRPALVKRMLRSRVMQVAAAVLVCVATAAYYLLQPPAAEMPVVADANINTDLFSIQFGERSNASFDQDKQLIDFCGTIKIIPKKNINLAFKTVCSNGDALTKTMTFREGQTYIALNYKHRGASEMIVIDEDMLFELPPVIKNQVSDQFKI